MTKANILIVEDNFLIALDLQDIIERLGYSVSAVVSTGGQAIDKAIQLKPDLIIMDIGLKGEMDGIETINKIREHIAIPVLYVTGNKDQLVQHNITDPCIDKPFSSDEIQHFIVSLLAL